MEFLLRKFKELPKLQKKILVLYEKKKKDFKFQNNYSINKEALIPAKVYRDGELIYFQFS